MITVLSGQNRRAVEEALTVLKTEFIKTHGELAIERIDGEEAEFDVLLGAVSTLPFLADKKLVVIGRLSANRVAADRLEELLANIHESVDVVFVEGKLDKRSQYFRLLKNLEGFKEFKEIDERDLAAWVVSEVSSAGGTINRVDAARLVNRIGPNQQQISSEIQKLILYDPAIGHQSIELLTDMTPRSSVFNLLDKAFGGDTRVALELYEQQRQQNVEPYKILGLIVWQLHAMALAKSVGKMSAAELAEKSGLSPYTAGKAQSLVRNKSLAEITKLVERAADIEYKSKTSAVDIDEGLKNFIASL